MCLPNITNTVMIPIFIKMYY